MMRSEGNSRHTKQNDRVCEQSGMQGQNRTEIADDPRSRGSSPKGKDSRTKQAIPLMSPMPLPVMEEPLSGCGSSKGKKPIILGMPFRSTNGCGPPAPSLPSPHLDVRSPLRSPLSAVSSLHEH